ncbi:MAG: aminopeptidase P family protein, partial [Chloroflexi bacterium]
SGLSELEVARALEEEMLKAGAEGVAFEILVASGPNSALPHHRAGKRRIEPGDVVILDFGCRVDGYCSDITRTVVCGEPPDRVRRLYEIVLTAQRRAVEAIRPGIAAQEVDRAARGAIALAGYAGHFIHRTGHGIGLNVHEEPYIVEGNTLPLEEGMTFSVEPGIYFRGEFGFRVEDVVVVTKEGSESLNRCPRTLRRVS